MSADKPEPIERHLVYEKIVGETGIWIADADGSNPKLLVAEGEYHEISFPQISPDGTQVAYVGDCGSSHCTNAYVVSTSGGKPRRFASGIEGISWSPDSQRIVGVTWPSKELLSVNVATGDEMKLARGDFWGWSISPDGEKVVFALEHGTEPQNHVFPRIDLYVANVDGLGDPKPITTTGDSAYPVWGPKSIAFTKLIPSKQPSPNTEFARNEIWRIQPDGTGRTTISGPLPDRFVEGYWHCIGLEPIDWSEDGSALLAAVDCEGIGQSVAVDPQTGAIRSLGEGTLTVALSRDEKFALVQWGDERVGTEHDKILIYPYAGGKPHIVAMGAVVPSWNR
jgi:dipeptidyl aminopeptidase/acylaminoacyl peptidase